MEQSGKFSELFEVIRDYSERGYDHQDKALQVIAGSYLFMFEQEDMPDARPVMEHILAEYDYVFTTIERGNLDPLSVDAVVRVARYREEHMEWGLETLSKVLIGIFRRSRTDETYADYVEDARIVLRGMEDIVAGSILEDLVEGTEGQSA